MPLFMPFKCCKSKRHMGRLGDWQPSHPGDENIALCVAGAARGEAGVGGEHRQLIQGAEAPAMSGTHLPGGGQAGAEDTSSTANSIRGFSIGAGAIVQLPPSPLPFLAFIFIRSVTVGVPAKWRHTLQNRSADLL